MSCLFLPAGRAGSTGTTLSYGVGGGGGAGLGVQQHMTLLEATGSIDKTPQIGLGTEPVLGYRLDALGHV